MKFETERVTIITQAKREYFRKNATDTQGNINAGKLAREKEILKIFSKQIKQKICRNHRTNRTVP